MKYANEQNWNRYTALQAEIYCREFDIVLYSIYQMCRFQRWTQRVTGEKIWGHHLYPSTCRHLQFFFFLGADHMKRCLCYGRWSITCSCYSIHWKSQEKRSWMFEWVLLKTTIRIVLSFIQNESTPAQEELGFPPQNLNS